VSSCPSLRWYPRPGRRGRRAARYPGGSLHLVAGLLGTIRGGATAEDIGGGQGVATPLLQCEGGDQGGGPGGLGGARRAPPPRPPPSNPPAPRSHSMHIRILASIFLALAFTSASMRANAAANNEPPKSGEHPKGAEHPEHPRDEAKSEMSMERLSKGIRDYI